MNLSSVSLLVAVLDWKLVRLLRAAMAPAAAGSLGPLPAPVPTPRPKAHPAPVIEPRRHVNPTPRIEPRLVHRPRAATAPPPALSGPAQPEQPRILKSPIQPPWKVLPWDLPPAPAPLLKVVLRPPDLPNNRGTVLDLFI